MRGGRGNNDMEWVREPVAIRQNLPDWSLTPDIQEGWGVGGVLG